MSLKSNQSPKTVKFFGLTLLCTLIILHNAKAQFLPSSKKKYSLSLAYTRTVCLVGAGYVQ